MQKPTARLPRAFASILGLTATVGRTQTIVNEVKLKRNGLCTCGSGKKFKKCCMPNRATNPISVYDFLGRPIYDLRGDNLHGYALVTGGDDDIPYTELIAFLSGKHRHAKGTFFLSAGSEMTGKSYRFATPLLAAEFARKHHPGKDFIVAAVPANWRSLNHQFDDHLTMTLPE
jgi:hypothetical protein